MPNRCDRIKILPTLAQGSGANGQGPMVRGRGPGAKGQGPGASSQGPVVEGQGPRARGSGTNGQGPRVRSQGSNQLGGYELRQAPILRIRGQRCWPWLWSKAWFGIYPPGSGQRFCYILRCRSLPLAAVEVMIWHGSFVK